MPAPSRANRDNARYRDPSDRTLTEKFDMAMDNPRVQRTVAAAKMASEDSAKADTERSDSNAAYAKEHAGMGALSDAYEGMGALKRK